MLSSLNDIPVLILDCQTSGSTPATGSIIEFAWCLTTAGMWHQDSVVEPISSFMVQLPKGSEPLSPRIAKLTGITAEDLLSAGSVTRRKLKRVLKAATASEALGQKPLFAIAHFASFEKKFLDELFGKGGFPIPLVCTHQIAKKVFPSLPSKGLRGVAGFLEWPSVLGDAVDGAYLKRSSAHVDATCWVWKGLCKELASRGVVCPDTLAAWLLLKEPKGGRKREYSIESSKRLALPNKPGVYRMLNGKGHILYVGKATSLHARVNSYFRGQRGKSPRLLEMVTQIRDIDVTVTETEVEAALLENDEIKARNPPYNVALKNFDQQIFFLSRDLSKMAQEYSPELPIGPFPGADGPLLIEQLFQAIHTSTEVAVPASYLEQLVEKDILGEGLLLFLEQYGLTPHAIQSRRQLLAKGLVFLREYEKIKRAEALRAEEAVVVEEVEIEDDEEDIVEIEWTPALVAESFKKSLRHAARLYRNAKVLFRLSHGVVGWQTKSKTWRVLVLNRSKVVDRTFVDDIKSLNADNFKVASLRRDTVVFTKTDYDRLRILRTELQIMRKAGYDTLI